MACSLILVNSEKAAVLMDKLNLSLKKITVDQAVKYNSQLRKPSAFSGKREERIKEYEEKNYDEISRNFRKSYWKQNLKGRIKYAVPDPLKAILLRLRYRNS